MFPFIQLALVLLLWSAPAIAGKQLPSQGSPSAVQLCNEINSLRQRKQLPLLAVDV
jgi:uncharacterized protein YkwD